MISQNITVLFRVKGVWCNSIISMIIKCWSDHRSDHNLLEWECRFTLGLNAAKNISKNASNKNCSELDFLGKNSLYLYFNLPQKWSYRAPKIATFEIESRITLELNPAKNNDYIRKYVKKLFRIKFPSKNSVGAYLYRTKEWS